MTKKEQELDNKLRTEIQEERLREVRKEQAINEDISMPEILKPPSEKEMNDMFADHIQNQEYKWGEEKLREEDNA